MKYLFALCTVLLCFSHASVAQRVLQGRVVNAATEEGLAGITLQIAPIGRQIITDTNGGFTLSVDSALEMIQIGVKALGVDTAYEIFPQSVSLIPLRVIPKTILLADAVIRSKLLPLEIVTRAIDSIPQNYPDSPYVFYGFYRQYQRQENQFQNLIEAQVAVLIRPKKGRGKDRQPDLFFAPLRLRKSAQQQVDIEDVPYREGISEQLFEEIPVYFPAYSTLVGGMLNHCKFAFEAVQSHSEYVIQYDSDVSSEDHGFAQKTGTSRMLYESYEKGTLFIDRKTLAFRRIERQSFRTPHFDYYHYFNWVMPSKILTREFVQGVLVVDFVRRGNRWFLSQACHGYTNDYYKHHPYEKRATLGEFYEWQTESVTREIPAALKNKFLAKPYLQLPTPFEGNLSLQHEAFPFLFFEEAVVRNALLKP